MIRLRLWVVTAFCVLAAPVGAWAGPPFQTDDPEPIDFRHYEFYTLFTGDGTAIETDTAGPAVEFNWGASQRASPRRHSCRGGAARE